MEKEFKTVEEIINDTHFLYFLNKNVLELITNRRNRPNAKEGYHYKRDWYDREDSEKISFTYCLENIESIWNKKSSLSAVIRNVIKYVCDKSLRETFLEYLKKQPK